MSNGGLSIWVGDLDGYISIGAINAANESEAKERELERQLDEIGEIVLLAGKATSAERLNREGISPSEWRHGVHKARTAIGSQEEFTWGATPSRRDSAEGRYFKAILDLGRSYAIARYAHWERLDYPSAITATLPHGIRALVNQFIAAEGITRSTKTEEHLRSALSVSAIRGISAYRRTSRFQAALHKIADDDPVHLGGKALHRDRTRVILSLARLYFSDREVRLSSKQELEYLVSKYNDERKILGYTENRITKNGQSIYGWKLRHLRSLLHFYPYSIRHSLGRALSSNEATHEAIINELALAHCNVWMVEAAGRLLNRRHSTAL